MKKLVITFWVLLIVSSGMAYAGGCCGGGATNYGASCCGAVNTFRADYGNASCCFQLIHTADRQVCQLLRPWRVEFFSEEY